MSSSFQNVVGTPRDAVPDISKTNYLQTSPDMTEPVNEDSEARIKDTKEFFDQMIELEELAAGKMDKRLAALSSLAGTVGDIRKQMLAKEADGLTKQFLKSESLKFQEQIGTVVDATQDSKNFQEGLGLGQINSDTNLKLAEKLDLSRGFIPDEVLDGKLDEHMSYYISQGRPLIIGDVLDRYNADSANSQDEWTGYRRQTLDSVYRTVIYNWIASGGDPNDPRLERKLFEKVLPVYTKELDTAQKRFVYTLEDRQKSERERVIGERFTKAVKTSQASFYGKEGIVAQIKEENNFDGAQSLDFAFDVAGKLVNKGALQPDEGLRLIDELPFTPTNEPDKTYKSYDEYLQKTKNKNSLFYANAQARVQNLRNIVNTKKQQIHEQAVTTSKVKAREYERDEIDPLVAASADGTLETSQIRSLYEEFTDPRNGWYMEGVTPIPKKLESMHNKTHTGGVRDKQVLLVDEFASQINEAVDGIDLLYRQKQSLEAAPKLGKTDSRAVKRLQAEFLRLLYGENGKELESVKMAIGQNQYTFDDKVREIEKDLLKNFDSIIAEPPIKPLGESVRSALELRNQVSENPDLLYSKTALEGEDVNRLFDYLNTGGDRNKDLGMFYKNARFKIVENGEVRVLGGYEAAEVRGKELGLYDQKGKKLMNFNAKILKDYKLVNDVENKTTAQKNLRVFSEGEGEQMKEFLDQHAINRSGGTSQAEDDSYSFVRRGAVAASERTGVTRLSGQQIVGLASNGSTGFGRYRLTNEHIKLLNDNGMIDLKAPFTEDKQSMAVVNLMSLNANRTNSISGAVTSDTQNFRKIINFSDEENELIKQVFPNLTGNYFAQFKNLEADVAKVILSDLERYQQNLGEFLQEDIDRDKAEKLRRSKLTKRQLRGFDD
ncbi:MAG: hypothetical protein CMC78_03175 [Flavobacteriaceae bacterium]|nr:hypothetical protein [Flavobacteriaceae bacterium]|tara:strand:+ start:987 stop:3656 length:2670 start_codon:yes stop_codon:yes gene_type:complete